MNDFVVPTAIGSLATPSITKVWNPSFLVNVMSTFCPALAVMVVGEKKKLPTSMSTLRTSPSGADGFGSPTAMDGVGAVSVVAGAADEHPAPASARADRTRSAFFIASLRLVSIEAIMLPASITIKDGSLPDSPGVYFYYDAADALLYVGKATSLKKRVASYFTKAHNARLAEMVGRIARIDYVETPTVIEALVLEANKIKALKPYYNVLMTDDKTFNYLVVTNERFPRPLIMRGHELEKLGVNPFDAALSGAAKKKFLRVFGPYTSGLSLKRALDLIRKVIPWSTCIPPAHTNSQLPHTNSRPCFDVHLGRCPGVCTGAISSADYRKIIRRFVLFFEGRKALLVSQMERDMKAAAKANQFEEAAKLRNGIYALEHIRDVALITREDVELPFSKPETDGGIDLDGRIEAFDISNISGTSNVASMTVFVEGRPDKTLYRTFRVKTVEGANDFASMAEVVRRRLVRGIRGEKGWELPQVMVIDGGEGQVNTVEGVIEELGELEELHVLGIAKGFDRRQDRLVYDKDDAELVKVIHRGKELFQAVRDEAHRFAVKYHRNVRGKKSLGKR
ncbi:hypothetical protein EPO34_01370 [Patescibacteria group bacterium]|nr:MAG: hypothetical protein EPO34_01370 [Patescibacteria group bacterium]